MNMDKKKGRTAKQVNDYLEYLKSFKYSPKSILAYRNALTRFFSFLTAKKIDRIADVTLGDLDAYRLELIDGGYTTHTTSLYLRSVRSLFKYLEETQQIFINPSKSIIIPRITFALKPVPTEEEVRRLLDQPDVSTHTGIRDRAVMETFYSTGTRLNELVGMNLYDLDFKKGRVKVTGKGDKKRIVPIGRQAIFWTNKYLKEVRPRFLRRNPDRKALWLGVKGGRINPLIVERFVSDYGKMAGIVRPVTPHALRRSCATHMLRGGAHPSEIQMLLGHSSLQVLSHYLKITITDMMETHAKGNPGQ